MDTTAPLVPKLNLSDLYERRQSRDKARLKAYNQILTNIYHRVRTVSRIPNNECYTLYTIPQFILGLPRLDLEDCVVYVVYQLRNAGFVVRYTYPSLIYISWEHHERDYLSNQNPIFRAMIESKTKSSQKRPGLEAISRASQSSANPTEPKRRPKKPPAAAATASRFDSTSDLLFNTNMSSASSRPMPLAEDYVPPMSFLQSTNFKNTGAAGFR